MKPKRKRILFTLATAALTLVAIEILAYSALGFFHEPQETPWTGGQTQTEGAYMIHPYIGFVLNPGSTPGGPVNQFGFFGADPLRKREPRKVIVAITGGSVAGALIFDATDEFKKLLPKIERFKGREVEVVYLACAGHRQPQQVQNLSYLLALGAEFDVVINLDGFNEVALPIEENQRDGYHYSFPRAWPQRVNGLPPAVLPAVVKSVQARDSLAALCRNDWIRHDWIGELVYRAFHQQLRNRVFAAEDELVRTHTPSHPQSRGPIGPTGSKVLAELWDQSSHSMRLLCEGRGIEYWHALQPNQYDTGSKPLTPAERRIAITENSPHFGTVTTGYPLLREHGKKLAASGEHFIDLSGVFRETQEAVYIDNCCHIAPEGNRIMARKIVEAMAASEK